MKTRQSRRLSGILWLTVITTTLTPAAAGVSSYLEMA